ncbi:predicted protein [Botrytis cinerea T4]|uniref:Uncharacterized protein n=1 Tax=Botryotinia fuckeliana (strain T4) TaxID=999810 RepID=G2YA99_BOTF4|nr:predicted protein [Botrytis cinerea T4]
MAFYNLDVHPVSQAFSVMLPARPLDYVETQNHSRSHKTPYIMDLDSKGPKSLQTTPPLSIKH